ncbi:related to capsular associated protein (CAP10) [Phialocephala subalpina]|uniref:Related to capsular associated protein (CAP10) n=1 Tax=Phialocephala subalpina TaxID=576137 RepID=A0A1L7WFR3_9HELO|nr:related to capsular associated protein (CAP10) [Phialocephala subalpina]
MLPQRILRLLPFSACILTLLVLGFTLYGPDVHPVHLADLQDLVPWFTSSPEKDAAPQDPLPDTSVDPHPIIELLQKANAEFNAFLDKETHDLQSAAKRYRERRGRHPPPGFDKWWAYAKDNNATIVEDFWDQIYHDLNPLWALDPKEMLGTVRGHNRLFKLRNGKVTHESDHFWMPIWQDLINDVAENLPDMDLAMNTMDEPRLFIAWEDMTRYMEKAEKLGKGVDHNLVSNNFSAFTEAAPEFVPEGYPWDGTQPLWPRAASACPPDSPARQVPVQTDWSQPPNLTTAHIGPHTNPAGYVSNYTLSTSICHQPDIQGLHGFFIESISASTGPKLFPLFGSSKLLQNSEILLPAAMYYKGDARFTIESSPVPWAEKTSSLVWRGLASGGRNKENNWKGFHRHRLVSMLNGTQALMMPNSSQFIDIESLPLDHFHLQSWEKSALPKNVAMGDWLNSFVDVGLNDLACFPREAPPPEGLTCFYTDYLFSPSSHLTLEEQHHHKYLVDVDGNSFSGRYRDFLRSGSLPIKATLFREWHDSRLIAWKHFIPMDNRFMDIYGIMEFFLGYEDPTSKLVGDSSSHFDLEHEAEALEFELQPPDPSPPPPEPPLELPPNTAESRRRSIERRAPKTESLNATYTPNRDLLAKKIALDGRDWAARVLRVEDMRVYTYRLLLEYARVMDENRETLGWVEDLKAKR